MLHVENLERTAGNFRLTVSDWQVERGSYVVVIGPSGSGKTMLLETLAGLQKPRAGRVWIDGRDATHLAAERRGIGLVYQDCWLFPNLTVRQNIHFGHRYHRRAGAAALPNADKLAEMLRISHLLDRKPEGLSAGERQRVALARALAVRPRMLLLDEPLGTLDPVMREHVAGEILSCHRALGITTIHVTHDHTEARVVGDAAAVLLEGRLQQSGPVDDVFCRPRTEALARFLGCENLHEGEVLRSDAGVRVRVGDVSFDVASGQGGTAAVCIRPEDLHVSRADAAADSPNGHPAASIALGIGLLTEVSFRGPQVRVVAECGDLKWVSLVGKSDWAHRGLSAGMRVALAAPAGAVHLIPIERPTYAHFGRSGI